MFAFQKISELSSAMDVDIILKVQIPYENEASRKGFRNVWEYNSYRAELIADSLSKNYKIPKEKFPFKLPVYISRWKIPRLLLREKLPVKE
ncbi:hypothetical protein LEP1GSC124_0768 [Leptospira interrogans serovar Pyrogenes str. 200701872]|uniref:Uncharacterized protein n=1 Tax=Leptospira interrogans serovar Pyrogenes str. 200701872 TaxID=1193029 RepID=M6ZG20_LEPIR|nr:hypothetical protein LEP1GSC124_0768 [Leptospira interrogans serovar Pyrogenes str. 200701872]